MCLVPGVSVAVPSLGQAGQELGGRASLTAWWGLLN